VAVTLCGTGAACAGAEMSNMPPTSRLKMAMRNGKRGMIVKLYTKDEPGLSIGILE
jgi:hypothetical protein